MNQEFTDVESFLQGIADEVFRLVLDGKNLARFREQYDAFTCQWEEYREARDDWEETQEEHWDVILEDDGLQDESAGPPQEHPDWAWQNWIRPPYYGAPGPVALMAWGPPVPDLPPDPYWDWGNREGRKRPSSLAEALPWDYARLAVIHDRLLPERPGILTEDAERLPIGAFELIVHFAVSEHSTIIDRSEIARALQAVNADLAQHAKAGAESSKGVRGKKVGAPRKRSWTQGELDDAIRDYKKKRAGRYAELVEGVKRGDRGARRAAREMFGRNAIARALGVKAARMVSDSPAWVAIAKELRFRLKRDRATGTARTQKRGKIGGEMASEQKAVETWSEGNVSGPETDEERGRVLAAIRKLPKHQAEPTLAKYDAGGMTCEDVEEMAEFLLQK